MNHGDSLKISGTLNILGVWFGVFFPPSYARIIPEPHRTST